MTDHTDKTAEQLLQELRENNRLLAQNTVAINAAEAGRYVEEIRERERRSAPWWTK